MTSPNWKREGAICAAALIFGLLILPFAIYAVGQGLIGEYPGGAGALALAEQIWTDLLSLRPAAWILVLSPLALIETIRLARRVWRPSPP